MTEDLVNKKWNPNRICIDQGKLNHNINILKCEVCNLWVKTILALGLAHQQASDSNSDNVIWHFIQLTEYFQVTSPYFFRRVLVYSMTTLRENLHLKLSCWQTVTIWMFCKSIYSSVYNKQICETKQSRCITSNLHPTLHLSNSKVFVKPVHSCTMD